MTAQLPAFITGWRKLPDELKLKVLEYALPTTIKSEHIRRMKYGLKRYESDFRIQERGWEPSKTIWSLLACPETSGLVMEALYHGSTVAVWVSPKDGTFELPPASVRHHVQHLTISLGLSVGSTDTLARLASVFPALKQANIKIHAWTIKTLAMRKAVQEALDAAPSIHLNSKTPSVDYWKGDISGSDGFQKPLFEKLTLSGKDVKERTKLGRRPVDKSNKTW
jgi:hypothetical protein